MVKLPTLNRISQADGQLKLVDLLPKGMLSSRKVGAWSFVGRITVCDDHNENTCVKC